MTGQMIGALILWLIIAIIVIVVVVYLLNWLYHRSTKEVSFVRTGLGGQKVVINGGAFVLPIIHEITPVNMNVLQMEVVHGLKGAPCVVCRFWRAYYHCERCHRAMCVDCWLRLDCYCGRCHWPPSLAESAAPCRRPRRAHHASAAMLHHFHCIAQRSTSSTLRPVAQPTTLPRLPPHGKPLLARYTIPFNSVAPLLSTLHPH